MTRASNLALLALCVGCAGAARSGSVASEPGELTPPTQEPVSLVLETAAGQHVDLADHRGKAVLVLAFTTDNLASQATMRGLERVARRHPEGLAAVAIAGDRGTPAELRAMLDAYRTVTALERTTLALASAEVRNGTSALGSVEVVPTLFFLNRAGVIVRRVEGLVSESQLEAMIAPALPPGR